MKKQHKFAAALIAMVLVCCGALFLNLKVSAGSEGKITGNVRFQGTPPHMRGIDMSKDDWCTKVDAADPAHMQTTVVGSGGGLENVVLYIDGWAGDATVKKNVPVFDQKNCMYVPHVLPMDVDQTFKVITSDQTTHNIHPMPNPMINVGWNESQPPGAPPIEKSWKNPEVIPVQCNIHPWMHGYFVVVKGPYAVTDSSGNYTLENVPPGTYTVVAWHEPDQTETQRVTVSAGQAATANFSFKLARY